MSLYSRSILFLKICSTSFFCGEVLLFPHQHFFLCDLRFLLLFIFNYLRLPFPYHLTPKRSSSWSTGARLLRYKSYLFHLLVVKTEASHDVLLQLHFLSYKTWIITAPFLNIYHED